MKEGDSKLAEERSEIAAKEEATLDFWQKSEIFKKTTQKQSPRGEFVFYEGPPTANGKPGIHHLESRAFKDVIPRYKTMQGFHVRRKAGWDTHGLPVELQVEKKLELKSKKEIEAYGIAAFNKECKDSVLEYVDLWDKFTKRIAYWVDQEEAYYTFNPDYMETLWWVVGEIDKKGLLYKDYRVVPWCARCGTALSSHELGQPEAYVDVKDLSVTAKFELVDEPGTFVLAWTTTPWTLPGNVALAVGEDIEYSIVEKEGERVIIATSRLEIYKNSLEGFEVKEEVKGSKLLGKSYKPLFPYFAELAEKNGVENFDNAYKIYAADFVTTEDGTGVVHTAVMYGADDFELGKAIGLPKMHVVDDEGKFIEGLGDFGGLFVKDPQTDVEIIKALAHTGRLFSKEKYEHSYPHCWRCKTPLIYYARDSWYIRMSEMRDTLVEENETINWEPSHIKDGRFGEWLKGIRDWAISRERYWGTPLPVWESEDGDRIIVDSIETLKTYTKKSGNTYFVMRHGEAESNLGGTINFLDRESNPLTEEGKGQVQARADELKDKNIDLIICSPLLRTRQTTEVVARALGIKSSDIIIDERLREYGPSKELEGKEWRKDFDDLYSDEEQLNLKLSEEGESRLELKRRAGEFLYELEEKYHNKKILVVSHNGVLNMMAALVQGADAKLTAAFIHEKAPFKNPCELAELDFISLPHNNDYELDLHRPYIDNVVLEKDGKEYRRVKEVMDVWFDSGAMPFAQDHYPFENKERIEGAGYPADYISEAIDQTRGWFYTLHAVGNLLGRGKAYKNVICLGHLLDEKGKKMSKSLGNVVDPWEAMERWGADTLRFWMYSVNGPGESKNFDPKTVDEVQRKVFNLLRNVVVFYELYPTSEKDLSLEEVAQSSTNPLDEWVLALLSELVEDVTDALDRYDVTSATRSIREFTGELSQWYIRRSRERLKDKETRDGEQARKVTRLVIHTLSRLMAPFAPFIAEEMYNAVKNSSDPESVHLSAWPMSHGASEEILVYMRQLREVVSEALLMRDKEGIKVRQPLASLSIPHYEWSGDVDFQKILKEEINVKEVVSGSEIVTLDTVLTDALIHEGKVRDLIRKIQEERKEMSLHPDDKVVLDLATSDEMIAHIKLFESDIKEAANITEIVLQSGEENISLKKVS